MKYEDKRINPENIDNIIVARLENWIYQTKCRKCGMIHEWNFASRSIVKWELFSIAMNDYIKEPRQFSCSSCVRKTVQDIVSFNEP